MDADLRDLLAAWRGGDVPDDRAAVLLDRLRTDDEFRAAVVAEARMLGMLKAVQATDPRWLLLEDEIGWTADDRTPLEVKVERRLPPPPRRMPTGWIAAALAAALLIGTVALLWPRDRPGPQIAERPAVRPTPPYMAVLVKQDGAEWDTDGRPAPTEGRPLPGGKLALKAGRATLTLFSGVELSVQGPADLTLASAEQVFCQYGKLRARVPPGAEGFAVLTPRAAVVDLGTEFGLNVAADGTADLMVFKGEAEVSALNADRHTLRSRRVEGQRAVSVEPTGGRIKDVPPTPDAFVAAPELIPPALTLDPGYPAAVKASRPWGYWRFESLVNGVTPNELPGGAGLKATGPVTLAGGAGNRSAGFGRGAAEQHFILDGPWTPPRTTGYAVEVWAMPEEVSNAALVNLVALVHLHALNELPAQKHIFILELVGRGHHLVHDPCLVRFLDRWPPEHGGGENVFSRAMYAPYRWHHLVANRLPDRMELYLNGDLVGATAIDPADATTPARLMVGRLKHGKQPGLDQERPFVGRLDELAVYDHPLTAEEVRRHYELGSGAR